MKDVIRFGKRGNLNPRYVRPFKILWIVGEVSYKLAFPLDISVVHLVFYVSMLLRYVLNEYYMLHWDSTKLDERLTFEEVSFCILARDVRLLRSRNILVLRLNGDIVPSRRLLGRLSLTCVSVTPSSLLIQILHLTFSLRTK